MARRLHIGCLLACLGAIASAGEPEAPGLLESNAKPAAPSHIAPLGLLPAEIASVARASANLPLPQRMEAISAALLERPYLLDPLGEGRAPDPDPLARYDAFDCLTFTEEVLALALAGDPHHAGEIRTTLRYDGGVPSYAQRRHFMELQWIPSNIEAGWLRDTTAEYGPVDTMEREVTASTWAAWRGRSSFQLDDSELPIGTMRLEVLSLDHAIAAAASIRPGSLLLTVRADRSWSPIWVSHVGIIVPADRPTVRHATKMGQGKVRDHDLVWYLNHLKNYSAWPAVGVAILEPLEQGPRHITSP